MLAKKIDFCLIVENTMLGKGGLLIIIKKWTVYILRDGRNSFLLRLPDKPAILIDNAKQHYRQTAAPKSRTNAWEKRQIQAWFGKKNVLYTRTDTKPIPVPIPIQKSKEIVVCERCTLQNLYLYNLYLYLYLHKTCTYSYSYSKI